jgi:hypothetical protein
MWKMTLKQRRRRGELVSELDALKRNSYSKIPADYVLGENPEEDEKYKEVLKSLQTIVEEMHAIESAARNAE